MKLKTLLLGSAAAFAVAGAAQAADLSVAEPVDYVRVCDAFGAGYWYIPGTDTCLKIGGYVRFDVNFHTGSLVDYAGYNGGAAATDSHASRVSGDSASKSIGPPSTSAASNGTWTTSPVT